MQMIRFVVHAETIIRDATLSIGITQKKRFVANCALDAHVKFIAIWTRLIKLLVIYKNHSDLVWIF